MRPVRSSNKQRSDVRIGFGRANMPDALRLLEACLGARSAGATGRDR